MMNVLIADDEPLARSRLIRMLEAHEGFTCIAEAANGLDALSLSIKLQPDLVFLDIHMPGKTGLEVANSLQRMEPPPAIIFLTAYAEHALEAYSVSPVDYLLKPISSDKLAEALLRVGKTTRAHMQQGLANSDTISVQCGTRMFKVPMEQVFYFVVEAKYVTMFYQQGEVVIDQSLCDLEQQFSKYLVRIHRNTLISRQRLTSLRLAKDGRYYVAVEGANKILPVSRRHVGSIKQLIKA